MPDICCFRNLCMWRWYGSAFLFSMPCSPGEPLPIATPSATFQMCFHGLCLMTSVAAFMFLRHTSPLAWARRIKSLRIKSLRFPYRARYACFLRRSFLRRSFLRRSFLRRSLCDFERGTYGFVFVCQNGLWSSAIVKSVPRSFFISLRKRVAPLSRLGRRGSRILSTSVPIASSYACGQRRALGVRMRLQVAGCGGQSCEHAWPLT